MKSPTPICRPAVIAVLVLITASCGGRVRAPEAAEPTTTPGPAAEVTGPPATAPPAGFFEFPSTTTSPTTPPTTTTRRPDAPVTSGGYEPTIEEVDSMLAGVDATLADLEQLLNLTAAALAAEEKEMTP